MIKKIFLPLWVFGAILLFLYSYTQVDLSLTLSRASIFQEIEKSFQYVGWFNRPLSSLIYIGIFIYLFSIYIASFKAVKSGFSNKKILWTTVITVTVILSLSYNAFSYDFFNYIFDAKILTYYHLNPYLHKALDFPGDPMLSFMHWTHRTYPYGPFWLLLTVPLSFLGSQIFIVTYFLYKILLGSFFLLTVWSIYRISEKLKVKNIFLPVIAFAFNPFVLSEALVSSHNDIAMMGLFMYGLYLILERQNFKGWVLVILSIATKFATAFAFLALIILKLVKKEKYLIEGTVILMFVAVVVASLRTTFQPWYLLYVLPLTSLISEKRHIFYPILLLSIAGVIFYLPFLYLGNWDSPVPQILNAIILTSCTASVVLFVYFKFLSKNGK